MNTDDNLAYIDHTKFYSLLTSYFIYFCKIPVEVTLWVDAKNEAKDVKDDGVSEERRQCSMVTYAI